MTTTFEITQALRAAKRTFRQAKTLMSDGRLEESNAKINETFDIIDRCREIGFPRSVESWNWLCQEVGIS